VLFDPGQQVLDRGGEPGQGTCGPHRHAAVRRYRAHGGGGNGLDVKAAEIYDPQKGQAPTR